MLNSHTNVSKIRIARHRESQEQQRERTGPSHAEYQQSQAENERPTQGCSPPAALSLEPVTARGLTSTIDFTVGNFTGSVQGLVDHRLLGPLQLPFMQMLLVNKGVCERMKE